MKEPQENQLSSDAKASTCECVEIRIHELMDLRQSLLSDTMVRDHISHCDPCAELVVDFGALNDSVSQIPAFTLQRLSDLQESGIATPARPSRPRHPVLFVASISCLMLVVLTSGIWVSNQQQKVAQNSPQAEPVEVAKVEATVETQPVSIPAPMQQFSFVTSHKASSPADFISAVNFEEISDNVEPYQDYIGMTAGLPGIRPVSKSVNATLHLIKTFSGQPQSGKQLAP